MERIRTSRLHIHGFFLLVVQATGLAAAAGAATSRCPAQQGMALLRLKRSFHRQPLLLPSWRAGTDCCLWEGVSCDDAASGGGRVTALDLGGHGLHSPGGLDGGALLQLTSLRRLNLAGNDFGGAALPASGLERLAELTHLNLSNAGFASQIPIGVGSLRELVSLDLSSTEQTSAMPLELKEPSFRAVMANLTKLRELRLDGVDMSSAAGDWCDVLAESTHGLQVLTLQSCKLSGAICSSFSRLRSLAAVDLSFNQGFYDTSGELFALSGEIPELFAELSSLAVLNLSNNGFNGSFPQGVFQLERLRVLDVSSNSNLSGSLPEFPATSLEVLDLSETKFSGQISSSIGNLKHLRILDISGSNGRFSGALPDSISDLSSLSFLDLSSSGFQLGELPASIGRMQSLSTLRLRECAISGEIPSSVGNLTRLSELDLSQNNLTGPININSKGAFLNLEILNLCCNSLSGLTVIVDDEHYYNISSSAPLPQINSLGLACCNMTKIPAILRYVVVNDLDLSCNQLDGPIPDWIWANQNDNIDVFKFNLSRNRFTNMELPLANARVYYLDLSFNNLQGHLPIPQSPQFLDYSNNRFSSVPEDLMARLSSSFFLNLANNSLHGGIPPIICNASSLKLLDLSYNHFSGRVPPCLLDGHLTILKLRHNEFEGTLPDDIKGGCVSQTIDLNGNQMEGKLPRSLTNCSDLEIFDVGNNNFVDSFPSWTGELPKLRVLVLRSNRFFGAVGGIPVENGDRNRTQFSSLQIIDLASNNFSGSLQLLWFDNLKSMMVTREGDVPQALENNLSGKFYRDTVVVTYKGATTTFSRVLVAFTVIDFSDNAFTGDIPESIGRLASLRGLNLSRNAFTGAIPSQLSGLTQLESLDLSSNQLDGEIPEALVSLTSIAWLNLSYNHLEGAIPQGGQFQTFGSSSFQGNAALCGKPLSVRCNGSNAGSPSLEHRESSEDRTETIVLYAAVGSGFGWGFAMAILFQVFCRS
ncbi:hypothetical protein E2562_010882 [Oryza meyeriana var. granulata]|uniref:non-specific serine/threonine protein kinase n=1 Tax=Oryza meyeriana var. granulata TaxID=110450 RepID=A0A6G1BWB9_9ORYZ|nr:hypothetical protein E2562_010882 [Oryza meyeriana var. granulata]